MVHHAVIGRIFTQSAVDIAAKANQNLEPHKKTAENAEVRKSERDHHDAFDGGGITG